MYDVMMAHMLKCITVGLRLIKGHIWIVLMFAYNFLSSSLLGISEPHVLLFRRLHTEVPPGSASHAAAARCVSVK